MGKCDINYGDVKGIVMVVLMKDSSEFLKNQNNKRYMHRFTNAVSDSGIKIPLLKKIAFVQLDKALEQFLTKTYNEDEDYDLLVELAMLADANNSEVRAAAVQNDLFKGIYEDAIKFSKDREVQFMTLAEEFAVYDWNYTLRKTLERGEKRGIVIGMEQLDDLCKWLYENGRDEDVKKATLDPEYRKKLFEDYKSTGLKKVQDR